MSEDASVPWGTDSGRAIPPGFTKQIRNRYVIAGAPAIFDCVLVGGPNFEIEWYHNGKLIRPDDRFKIQACGGGSFALVVMKTLPEDAGEYVISVRTPHGTVSSSAVLEVTVPFDKLHPFPPAEKSRYESDYSSYKLHYSSIPTPPDRGPFISEVTGHYLTLSWIPTLRPPPRYPQITYVVEARELPDNDWVVIDYNIPQPCCRVRNLALDKSYQFRVRAENIYGIGDPSPASPPSQLMAKPPPVMDKHKKPIHNYDPYEKVAIRKAYAGKYACAPWFAPRESEHVHCAENNTVEVLLWVNGYPDPEIKWTFRGWPVGDKLEEHRITSKTYHGNECVLTIRSFTKEDAGQYQCTAVNEHGEAVQKLFLDLAEPPSFMQTPENKTVNSGGTVRLDVRVDAKPDAEIKWLKDWHPVATSTRIKLHKEDPYMHSLIIHDTILRDTGIYTCVAANDAGRVTASATVTVQAEPLIFEFDPAMRGKKVTITPREAKETYTIETS